MANFFSNASIFIPHIQENPAEKQRDFQSIVYIFTFIPNSAKDSAIASVAGASSCLVRVRSTEQKEYTYAFAGSKISLLDGFAGVSATFGTVDPEQVNELADKYAEIQDSFNSAKIGCVDNVIEPEFVRQYVISALQMIIG